eukprot:Colp12_sorted_trinity150504_noHs@6157
MAGIPISIHELGFSGAAIASALDLEAQKPNSKLFIRENKEIVPAVKLTDSQLSDLIRGSEKIVADKRALDRLPDKGRALLLRYEEYKAEVRRRKDEKELILSMSKLQLEGEVRIKEKEVNNVISVSAPRLKVEDSSKVAFRKLRGRNAQPLTLAKALTPEEMAERQKRLDEQQRALVEEARKRLLARARKAMGAAPAVRGSNEESYREVGTDDDDESEYEYDEEGEEEEEDEEEEEEEDENVQYEDEDEHVITLGK